jgi:hypothetical protein
MIRCEAEYLKECLTLQSIRRIVNLREDKFNKLFFFFFCEKVKKTYKYLMISLCFRKRFNFKRDKHADSALIEFLNGL